MVQPVAVRRFTSSLPELFLGLLSLALAAVWVAHMFASTIHDARHARDTLTITGSARKPISSNLVRWSLSVSGVSRTPAVAAGVMRRDILVVEAFLRRGGIPAAATTETVVRSATIVTRISKTKTRTTYRVSQGLRVSTSSIDVVEGVATKLAELIEQGVDVSAEPLEYISTDLAKAKLDALQAATEEARRRADILVSGLGGKLGPMRSSSLGVYQITPRDSTQVSDYGINDTTSREKDVTAVVSATFAVER
jgi:uncharacterized protein